MQTYVNCEIYHQSLARYSIEQYVMIVAPGVNGVGTLFYCASSMLILFGVQMMTDCACQSWHSLLQKLVKPQDRMATSNIVDLPDEVLTTVVIALTSHAHGNPGDVCRLMLVRTAANCVLSCVRSLNTKIPSRVVGS